MALENKFQFKLNVKEALNKFIPVVTANDYTVFLIEVYDGKEQVELLETYRYVFVVKATGKDSVMREATLNEDGLVVVELGYSETRYPGVIDCALQIYDADNKRISTMRMQVNVKGDMAIMGGLPAEDSTLVLANEAELARAVAAANDIEAAKGNAVSLSARFDSVTAQLAEIGMPNTQEAVGEWWIHPVATFQNSPYPRTVMGAVAPDGKILAIEYNHATLKKTRYEVAQSVIDDHNCPALWVKDGHRPVLVWTNHNNDNFLRFKVGSLNGDLGSLAVATEHAHNTGQPTSYSQLHHIKHLSDSTKDTFILFYRSANVNWRRLYIEVNQVTGRITIAGTVGTTIVSSPDRQCYISTADAHNKEGNQVIRLAWGYNPAQPVSAIYYIEIDVVTGAITSPYDTNLNANIAGTNLPIIDTTLTPMIPEPVSGMSRRFFYTRPGPDNHAVAYADWEIGKENEAVYKLTESEHTESSEGGLIPFSNTGYLQSEPSTEFNEILGTGFEVTVFARIDEVPTLPVELIRKFTSTAQGGTFYFRVTPEGTLRAGLPRTGGANAYTTAAIVPGGITGLKGYRFKVNTTDNTLIFYYSLNGETWVMLETLPLTGTGMLATSSDPFIIGTITASGVAVPDLVTTAYVSNLTGEKLIGFDDISSFGTGATGVDDKGKTWTLTTGAEIIPNVVGGMQLITNEFGVSGERVGFTEAANYLAGMAFENPSYDGTVITAHTNNTKETVKKWRKSGNNYIAETLLETDTSNGRIVRPYVPVNNGPISAILTKMNRYNHYTDYEGDIITS